MGDIWNALLRWSMAQHDGTRETNLTEMTPERRQFLQNVFDEMVVDDVKRMKLIVEVLKWPENTTQMRALMDESKVMLSALENVQGKQAKEIREQRHKEIMASDELKDDEKLMNMIVQKKIEALDELDERVESIDYAMDLHKIGGLRILLLQLNSEHNCLVWRAAQALATVISNNMPEQKHVMELEGLDKLMNNIYSCTNAVTGVDVAPKEAQKNGENSQKDNGAASDSQNNQGSSTDAEQKDGTDKDSTDTLEKKMKSMTITHTTSKNDTAQGVLGKLCLCISRLIDHYPEAEKAFLAAGGLAALLALVVCDDVVPRLRKKCIQILSYLARGQSRKTAKHALVKAGVHTVIASLIGHDDIDLREKALALLLEITHAGGARHDKADKVIANLAQDLIKKDHQLKLRLKLEIRLAVLCSYTDVEDQDMVRDEVALLHSLLAVIFNRRPTGAELARVKADMEREKQQIEEEKAVAAERERLRRLKEKALKDAEAKAKSLQTVDE